MLPDPSGPVVIQEEVKRQGEEIVLLRPVGTDDNVRPKGSVLKAGSAALRFGTLITPGAMGHLATVGIDMIDVWRLPTIALLTTGNEAVPLGIQPVAGQVHECNSVAIRAALAVAGFTLAVHEHVPDESTSTENTLRSMLAHFDCVILSGGVSVGEHDHVAEAIASVGAHTVFHKVNQKPGKPFLFARLGPKPIFGLPGNPAAALTCLYFYVIPALQQMSGHILADERMLPLATQYAKTDGKAHLVRFRFVDGAIVPIEGQTSAELATFSIADGIALLPEADLTDAGIPVRAVFINHI
jgi:molybdopterin molybdotransferase